MVKRGSLLCSLLLLSSCVRLGTWSGDVYECDRELLERVASAKADYTNSEKRSEVSTCQTKSKSAEVK